MALIEITISEEDVRAVADANGISFEVAMERAEGWAKSIEDTATSLCNEQLSSVIRTNEP